MKKCKLTPVEVWWTDSSALDKYWHDVEEGLETAKEIDLRSRSIGMLVKKNKNRVILTQSMSLSDNHSVSQMGGILTIPRSAVIRISKLK